MPSRTLTPLAPLQLTLYIFAIVGVWSLAGYLSQLPASEYEYPDVTFDSFVSALIALFHVSSSTASAVDATSQATVDVCG